VCEPLARSDPSGLAILRFRMRDHYMSPILEDPLAYLPRSTTQEFHKGRSVYCQGQTPASLYLVVAGTVKLSRISERGRQVLMDIYRTDDLFGETALIRAAHTETCVALEDAQVMIWTPREIDRLVVERPKLAIALMQLQVRRLADLALRMESLATENISRRLARTLLRFSERLGLPTEGGAVQIIALTHESLAECVGTSREIVTHHMNQFRRLGYLRYSRKGIQLQTGALANWLSRELAAVSHACEVVTEHHPGPPVGPGDRQACLAC
jgi:CRP/FNR family transcriptional regulator, cyclic AMP receptor protein